MRLYRLSNHRSDAQLADMRALDAAGICVFCPERLTSDPEHPVLHETEHWTVTPNKFPYRGTKLHLMLVPRVHATDLLDLPEPVRAEYWTVLEWVRARYGLGYYCVGSRNGDFHYTAGSIAHVHVHVIVGDPEQAPVRFKMSSRPDPD